VTNDFQVIRSFRIFRVFSRTEALKDVLAIIGRCLPRLGCFVIFSCIIMFIFAILFTEQYRDMYTHGQSDFDYFSRLDYTFLTLYQLMTLDNWIDVLRNVMETYPIAWIPFLIYVSLTAFIFTNLITAVICKDILDRNNNKDKEDKMIRDMENVEYIMPILSTCCEICDQLDLPKPLPKVIPEASGSEIDITKAQSDVSIDLKSSSGDQSILDGSESRNYTLPEVIPEASGSEIDIPKVQSDVSIDLELLDGSESRNYTPGVFSCATTRNLCGKIVDHQHVQRFVMSVIFVNSILLAVGTFDFVAENPSTKAAFDVASEIFLVLYTVENAMQLISHGPRQMFKDGWLTFDFILIVLSWVLSFSPAFRAFRVLRLIHAIPKFEAMRAIIGTLTAAIPEISAVIGILLVFFYVFAVMFTMLFKDIPVGVENGLSIDYFSRIDKTLLTLFQVMTMDGWAPLSRELAEHAGWAPYLVILFLSISGFLFVNAIVALICESYKNYTNKKKEQDKSLIICKKKIGYQVIDIMVMQTDILNLLKSRDTSFNLDIFTTCPQ